MQSRYLRFSLVGLLLIASACQISRKPQVNPLDHQEQQLAEVRAAAAEAIRKASADLQDSEEKVRIAQQEQLQQAANSNGKSSMAARTLPGRAGEVTRIHIRETAEVLPPAQLTTDDVASLLEDLDELATTNEQLQAKHTEALAELKGVREKADGLQEQLVTAKEALHSVEGTAGAQVLAATEKYAESAKKIALVAQEEAAKAKDKAALDQKLMYLLCGVGILLCIGAGVALLPQLGGPHLSISGVAGVLGVSLICLGYYIPQLPLWLPITFGAFVCIATPIAMWIAFRKGVFTDAPEKIGDQLLVK